MSADELVRIRIVGHDVAATRDCDRIDGVGRHSYGTGELHSAVLIGVFQADIENGGLVALIQAFFQLFFRDAFDGHGAILAAPRRIVKVAGRVVYADRRCAAASRGTNVRARAVLAAGRTGWALTGTSPASSCTAHPFDRLPQWMHRRKMEPDAQVMPKSCRPDR